MQSMFGQLDPAIEAGALKVQRVAIPGVGDAEGFGDPLGDAFDRGTSVLQALAVLALDVDSCHARIVRPACRAC